MRAQLSEIIKAVPIYRYGGVFAYPAEAVWGLAGNPFLISSYHAVQRIKHRNRPKPLLLVASSFYYFKNIISEAALGEHPLIKNQWPGPYTWVFQPKPNVPKYLLSADGTIALRISNDRLIAQLCSHLHGPIFSTSANYADQPPLLQESEVRSQFGHTCDAIIKGSLGVLKKPTSIRLARGGQLIRS